MNRLRGFVIVLLVAVIVGCGIAYHLNTVKEYENYLTLSVKTTSGATLENITLATENQMLKDECDELLLITMRAFAAGVASYEEVEEILKRVIELRAEFIIAGKQVPPIVDNLLDLLKRVRDRLLEVFIEDLPVPYIPPMPDEDQVISGSFDSDLYAGRYHTRKRTSRFFSRVRRVG